MHLHMSMVQKEEERKKKGIEEKEHEIAYLLKDKRRIILEEREREREGRERDVRLFVCLFGFMVYEPF